MIERLHILISRTPALGDARWYCKCGRWEFPYKTMAHRSTRNNRREAELSYMAHRDAQPGAYGAGPGYN